MKKILITSIIATTLITPSIFAQDRYGCETWEGEKWDARYGKCMDADDYYDDDYYPVRTQNYQNTQNQRAQYASTDDDVVVYNWAKNNGLTTAPNFGQFRDESKITRDEVAVIVQRALNKNLFQAVNSSGNKITFKDDKYISQEFKSATSFVQNAGIMRGNNGFFYPKNFLTEYEALIIVARATAKTEIQNPQQALEFARKIGDGFEYDDVNDLISRWDFFELIKKAKERL